MFKKIFKWLYLIVSGISFIFVIFLIAFFGYLVVAEEEVKVLVDDFQEYRAYKKNQNLFEVVDIDEEISTSMEVQGSGEEIKNENDPKIKISIKDGVAFLRPSQIVYIESGEDYHILSTLNGRKLELNKRTTPLKSISDKLNKYNCFFPLKSFVINCNYIEQVKKISEGNYSKTYVVMEDDYKIPLPEKSVQKVLEILEDLHE